MIELKIALGINEWLDLIKEDKNLNGAYISLSQYIYKLEQALEDETLNKHIAQGHRKEVQHRELRERKELKRYKNIVDDLEKELNLNLKFKVIGVKRLLNKIQEAKYESK